MTRARHRWLTGGLAVLALTLLHACAVTGVGVDGSVGVGYDAGYYEPWGYDYGGWGGGYRVGPGRGGERATQSFDSGAPTRTLNRTQLQIARQGAVAL